MFANNTIWTTKANFLLDQWDQHPFLSQHTNTIFTSGVMHWTSSRHLLKPIPFMIIITILTKKDLKKICCVPGRPTDPKDSDSAYFFQFFRPFLKQYTLPTSFLSMFWEKQVISDGTRNTTLLLLSLTAHSRSEHQLPTWHFKQYLLHEDSLLRCTTYLDNSELFKYNLTWWILQLQGGNSSQTTIYPFCLQTATDVTYICL